MTTSQDAILAPRVTIAINGKTYQARQTTLGDLADFENHLRGQQAVSFSRMAREQGLDSEIVAGTLARIYNIAWTPEAKAGHAASMEGMLFFLWCAIREDESNLSYPAVKERFKGQDLTELIAAMEAIQPPSPDPEPGVKADGSDPTVMTTKTL